MSKRSLQASQEGARLARKAFDRKGWTQENLAAELELKTRQPIWRFFTCRPVERHIFVELCHILDLNWWEIAERPPEFLLEMVKDQQEASFSSSETKVEVGIEGLVEQVRASCRDWIENQCGVLRILDIGSPACFDALYVPAEVIQPFHTFTPSHNPAPQTKLADGLQKEFRPAKKIDNRVEKLRIPAIQAVKQYSKLRILGKPGSGKTSFLQHLALQCIRGEFETNKAPLLIHLGSFAVYSQEVGKCSLLDFICYELSERGINDTQTVTALLTEGRFLLMLDALDELIEPDSYTIYKEITRFSERYYKNQYVIAARRTSDRFEFSQFADVEIADYTDEQITALATKWFNSFSCEEKEHLKLTQFLQELQSSKNQSIAELVRSPLLFNSIAQLFERRGELTSFHLEIYETCLNILFERWDQSRGVRRSSPRSNMLIAIEQAVLMQLGAIGFQQHRSGFERREIIQCIEEYLYQLHPDVATPICAQAMSKTVFAALEHHHGLLVENLQGLFSFSFRGFQNYFTAQWVVSSKHAEGVIAALAYQDTNHPNHQWQEVVLLSHALSIANEKIVRAVHLTLNQLETEHPDLSSYPNWAQQIPLKSSIYQQLHAGFTLWQQILQTPALLASHAYPLSVLYALAQQLLLEILLDSLVQCVLLSTSEEVWGLDKFISLLDRAIFLSNWAGYSAEFQVLQSLRQKFPGLNQTYVELGKWWKISRLEWAQQLQQVLADWYADAQGRKSTADQQELLEPYAYFQELLANRLSLQVSEQEDVNSNISNIVNSCSTSTQKMLIKSVQHGGHISVESLASMSAVMGRNQV